jgi:hypothetical protein
MASSDPPTVAERAVVVALTGGLVVYALAALVAHRWISGFAAPLIAVLLVRRHARARFSAYVFFSALLVRGVVAGSWPLALFAGAGILVLQLPSARRVWPRLVAGATRSRGNAPSTRGDDYSRMKRP